MKTKLVKSVLITVLIFSMAIALTTCATNPLTGKRTMAFVSNNTLFPASFQQYNEFLSENTVITGTAEAEMVARVGNNIRLAVEKWYAFENISDSLKDYRWEYNLVDSKEINAWCLPGGKIVVYTGILEVTKNEDALAVVLGHEVSHALLDHGQQRMSAGILQQLGAIGVMIAVDGSSQGTQLGFLAAYGITTTLGTLSFSRAHESQADEYGLKLAAIAGYRVEESVDFWQRMNALGSSGPEFLSTHPSSSTRISQLRGWIPEAKAIAAEVNGSR